MTAPLFARPIDHSLIHGTVELEPTPRGLLPHRLPGWARAQWADPQLAMAESQPSGVRLAFATTASVIELDTLPTKRAYAGLPARPDGVYDLCVDGILVAQGIVPGGDILHIDMAAGSASMEAGQPGTLRFAGLAPGMKRVEIWLPHNETTLLVALRSDAALAPVPPTGRRWVHHGSSISQGSDAASPTGIWPAVAAAQSGLALTNLGYGGSALLDPFVARTISNLPAELISLELGINLVNTDAMRLRAFGPAVHGFLDTIRERHATTPLLIVSPILCPIHEDTPGPTAPDFGDGRIQYRAAGDPAEIAAGKLTLNVIRTTLARIIEQRRATDPNLHYLDGRELYGPTDHARLPLPDRLHPDSEAHRLIGERFAALALSAGGLLGLTG